ncbi:hypothetical protein [Leptospira perolatii]|uniref:hypothetical protein n=1 Tax=Leptospira perolatii TaxID=2023191 RepID=UPI001FAFA59E|nr:hypothetical protein [Leptospira perolatii]
MNPKESLTGAPTLRYYIDEVKATLKDRGYTVDKKSQFTGSVFKGNSVIFKLQFPAGTDREIVRKLGIGLAHGSAEQSVMVQIFLSNAEDKKLSPLFTGFVEPSFVYEWDARFGENHFLVEIRLEESESNVANFELLFGSQLYKRTSKFGTSSSSRNENSPASPTKESDNKNQTPGTNDIRNYFEVFKKEF